MGISAAASPKPRLATFYKYRLDQGSFSRPGVALSTGGPARSSQVVDPRFQWTDRAGEDCPAQPDDL